MNITCDLILIRNWEHCEVLIVPAVWRCVWVRENASDVEREENPFPPKTSADGSWRELTELTDERRSCWMNDVWSRRWTSRVQRGLGSYTYTSVPAWRSFICWSFRWLIGSKCLNTRVFRQTARRDCRPSRGRAKTKSWLKNKNPPYFMLLLSAVTQKSDVRKSKDVVFKYYVGDSESHTYSKK